MKQGNKNSQTEIPGHFVSEQLPLGILGVQ